MEDIKLYNGDCLEVLNQIQDESVDLILTDLPYGMNYQPNRREHKHSKILDDCNLKWLSKFIQEQNRVLKNNSHLYIFCSWHNIDKFKQEIEKHFKIENILIWRKQNHGLGDLKGSYGCSTEFIFFAQKGRKELNGKRERDVLEFNRVHTKLHPTMKPVDLLEFLVSKSSKKDDIVLDCFMGSGSTGVACKKTKRKFIGIELDEDYFKIAKERIENN